MIENKIRVCNEVYIKTKEGHWYSCAILGPHPAMLIVIICSKYVHREPIHREMWNRPTFVNVKILEEWGSLIRLELDLGLSEYDVVGEVVEIEPIELLQF